MYRILVEDVNHGNNTAIEKAAKYFDNFTLIEAKGYWNGLPENTYIFEIETDEKEKVMELAQLLKASQDQESVFVQFVLTNSYFI